MRALLTLPTGTGGISPGDACGVPQELKVMHELGPQMTEVGCLMESCSIKVDRPRCLTDLVLVLCVIVLYYIVL